MRRPHARLLLQDGVRGPVVPGPERPAAVTGGCRVSTEHTQGLCWALWPQLPSIDSLLPSLLPRVLLPLESELPQGQKVL